MAPFDGVPRRQRGGHAPIPRGAASPKPAAPVEITLRHTKVCELLGIEIPVKQQIEYLQRLELTLLGAEHGVYNTFRVPSFRVDLKREVDLTEDISMQSLGVCGGIMDVYVERWPAAE